MTDYIQAIDNGLQRISKESGRDERGPLRLSALGRCPRQIACEIRDWTEGKEPHDYEGRTLRIFELGRARGEALSTALGFGLETDVTVTTEAPITLPCLFNCPTADHAERIVAWAREHGIGPETIERPRDNLSVVRLALTGHADAVVSDGKHATIIEFKTKNGYAFDRVARSGAAEMGENYLAQLCAYWIGTEQENLTLRVNALWIVENKDDCELLQVEPGISPREAERIASSAMHDVFLAIQALALGTELPSTRFTPNEKGALPWQCNYCNIGPAACGSWPVERLKVANSQGSKPKWSIK